MSDGAGKKARKAAGAGDVQVRAPTKTSRMRTDGHRFTWLLGEGTQSV